ncbi:MAG: hypothetical protein J6T54_12395 [Fibrobacter sp.]|nr:hypothetical protein [Fibrobacter sp.]
MARIYNPTMLMLDPSNVMNAVRLGREREAQEQEARKGISQGIGEIGGALAGIGGRALRQSEIGELPEDADDEWKAVVERFVDTGDISGINAYKQRKAEEAYRDKMLALQKLQAKGAKAASEAALAEGKQKDKEMLERERDDAEYGLTKAITAFRKGQNQEEAIDDYNYYRKKLMRIYPALGIPTDEIRELKKEGTPVDKTSEEILSEMTLEPTEEKQPDEFSGEEYAQRKLRFLNKLNKKYEKDSEVEDLVKEGIALTNSNFGKSDRELIDAMKVAREIKSDETKLREAKEYRRKMADTWKAMDKSDRYSLTRKDPKTAKKMQEAHKEFYGGE